MTGTSAARISLTARLATNRISYHDYRKEIARLDDLEPVSRQVARRQEFDRQFHRLDGQQISTSTRRERRKLARAKAAGWWKGQAPETRGKR